MEAASRLVNRPAPPQPAAAAALALPQVCTVTAIRPQCRSLAISRPGDAAEVEARSVARQVVRMPAGLPASRPGTLRSPVDPARAPAAAALQSASAPAAVHAPASPPSTQGGEALPEQVRRDMEPRFGADFGAIRIHRDARAAQASRQLNAAAFTIGNRIHFGEGQWQPHSLAGRELIAHELTHAIQQGAAIQLRRSALPPVSARSPLAAQRFGLGDVLDRFARLAEGIPGFRMFTLVLGRNPITLQAVERSAGQLLRAALELIPGGVLLTRALDQHGLLDRAARWLQQQIDGLGMAAGSIRQALDRFLDGLSWHDAFEPGELWARATRILTGPIARITAFVGTLAGGILNLVRDAVLRPLAALAQGTRGWSLLCAVLGRDPISGDPAARTADSLIGGFMRLIGQEEIWLNLQRAKAVERAFAWFQGAVSTVLTLVAALPQRFMATLRSLSIDDLLALPQTFARVARVFGDFVGSFVRWGHQQLWRLLEIIFAVVAPALLPYLRRAAGAFRTILANPVRFVGNLVRAAALGFRQFAARVALHLRAAIVGWLAGTLAGTGVHVPQAFTLPEIVRFVLSVLGLGWQSLRIKLVRILGEKAVAALEAGFDLVVTLVRDGPAAAWERIRESLANLREMVMERVLGFVRDRIVTAAVTRLLSMLSPAGAFIQAIIATYNTILFFVERLRQIAQVAAAFIDSIAAIAGGVLAAAADRVERTLGGLLVLAISFLARMIGLGRVSDAIARIIEGIRAPIDRALDRVVAWIARLGRRFMGAARGAAGQVAQWWRQRKPFRTAGGQEHELYFLGDERNPRPMVASRDPQPVEARLDAFRSAAEAANARSRKRKALALIGATRAALRADPNDAIVVANLRTLFGIFDDPPLPRETRYRKRTRELGGDTVAIGMSVDWLNDAWRRTNRGSPPRSGAQRTLMSKLQTDPGEPGSGKYVRGHILNEHIGGAGNEDNLFPITANANGQHLHSTESRVKRWVDDPNSWVFYEVNVEGIRASLDSADVTQNYINATFSCRAVLKDEDGSELESYLSAIPSSYRVRQKGASFAMPRAPSLP